MLKRFILALLVSLTFGTIATAADTPAPAKNPVVLMETTLGNVKIELFQKEAPISVKNFLDYVNSGFFSNTIFHRVIPNFMIQGGGFEPGMKQKDTQAPIKNEADNGLKNDNYTVAMARTNDPNSATSQFFINVKNNDFLNHSSKTAQGWGYAVFGKVTEGLDVINEIKKVPTGRAGHHSDVPLTPVVVESAEVISE